MKLWLGDRKRIGIVRSSPAWASSGGADDFAGQLSVALGPDPPSWSISEPDLPFQLMLLVLAEYLTIT